nr:retrovirus-related Pol polyprotein from transposon TNT 1-94 [Tanacetum cinerariifolium]
MDLFGPSAIKSYGGNLYTLVIVDDYSRYTWTRFLKTKNEAFEKSKILSRKIQNQLGSSIIAIRTDHGREFDNEVQFGAYCDAQGIIHNFSAPRTPQSNGAVEKKNRTLQEMSRTMLNEQFIPQKFWYNAVDTSTYILNRILFRPILEKIPYEIFRGRKPFIEYFKVFRTKCFILNTRDYLTKFDPKSYEGVFLGYSQNSKAYIVLNKHTIKVEESLNVTFDEIPPPTKLSPLVDDDVGEEEAIIKNTKVVNNNNNEEDESIEVDEIVNIKESKNHPLDQVIENLNQRTLSQSKYIKEMLKKFGLEDSKPTKTPMPTEIKFTKDDEADSVDSSKYRDYHLEAVKRIFRYIRGTSHLGLWYPKKPGVETIVYADSDHTDDYVDLKSTSDICIFMGCCLTYWFTKKQTALAISTTKVEYVSAGKACQQALWMKQALIDYVICLDDVPIMCDNKGAIDLSKNLVQHFRTKHIEICHHFLRDNIQKGNISIKKVASEDNIVDLRLGLGMMELIMDSDSPSSQK